MSDQLRISLEDHLLHTLRPLQPRLPDDLAHELAPYLSTTPPAVIPYTLLFSISKWTRSDAGLEALHAQTPSLDPHSYSMVSLLAGTTTSPERYFGPYTPPTDPTRVEAAKKKERKAITALLNALLSIVGSAFAAWWAARNTGWRNEWSVLLGLFVAMLVAVSEGALFLLWQSPAKKKRRLRDKKVDEFENSSNPTPIDIDDVISNPTSTLGTHVTKLRQRK